MSSIQIAGDTSGSITLSAPAVAGTNTITLPAVTGTILTTAYTGNVTFSGDLAVDTNTLYVDSTNNRVGIGTSSPQRTLHSVISSVSGASYRTQAPLVIENNGGTELQIISSSANGGQIRFGDGDSNFRGALTYEHGTDYMVFHTSASERMRIDSSGNVGIGTSSPLGRLSVLGEGRLVTIGDSGTANTPAITVRNTTDTGYGFFNISTYRTRFFTEGSERMVINESGNVGIGTSSPTAKLDLLTSGAANVALFRAGAGYNSFLSVIGNGNSFLSTSFDIVQNSSNQAELAQRANAPMVFYTNNTETMRITNAGNVGIGTSSPSSFSAKLVVNNGTNKNITFRAGIRLAGSAIQSIQDNAATDSPLEFYTQSQLQLEGNPITFYNNGERMRIDSSGNVGIGTSSPSHKLDISGVAYILDGSGYSLSVPSNSVGGSGVQFRGDSNASSRYWQVISNSTAYGLLDFQVSNTNASSGYASKMVIDSSGNVGIGTTSPAVKLQVEGSLRLATVSDILCGGSGGSIAISAGTTFNAGGTIVYRGSANPTNAYGLEFLTGGTERMRIDSSGNVFIAKTADDIATIGHQFMADGAAVHARSGGSSVMYLNRTTDDGTLISFRQGNTQEGTISVSGTTVSYNGGHLARFTQLTNSTKDETILKGTVLSNLDDMCVYVNKETGETSDNEQLNKVKVSDVEGDPNVAGVHVSWIYDEQHDVEEINMAMTGDMIIRIAQGVTVNRGDLLMSAGDGTAKPQGDDIVRSKTIAKVTSTNVTCTYEDGSYCVPCVLMAC